jgi:hypothetical protein
MFESSVAAKSLGSAVTLKVIPFISVLVFCLRISNIPILSHLLFQLIIIVIEIDVAIECSALVQPAAVAQNATLAHSATVAPGAIQSGAT